MATTKKKICLACDPAHAEHLLGEFYISKNPMHKDGKVPWCKTCIVKYSLDDEGRISEEKFVNVLRQLDKPYYKDILESSINQFKREHSFVTDEEVPLHGKEIIGLYFKNLNTMRQVMYKSYSDSEKEGFVRKKGSKTNISSAVKTNNNAPEIYNRDMDDFEITEDMRDLFGDGYSPIEYKKMNEKYEKLKQNYSLQTNLHQEALCTYVRFKVKEEMATAAGNADEAKKWYESAQRAAADGKLTPKQLTKADLDGGVNSVSELVKTLEQTVDVIKILPQFKYRANDAPDFNIFCYINYERELNGQPQAEYSDIYSFYDKKKAEYIAQNGDPFGIFTHDTTEKNRDTVKTFIKLPDDYDELAGDKND